VTRPEDRTGDEPPAAEREGLDSHDESQLLHDLGALLDELRGEPDVPALDYDDIWRRIDRDIG
jgi:hypothetical protein